MSEVQDQESGATGARMPLIAPDEATMRVLWRADDRFDIQVRDHTITVDQPVEIGGADVGPTPTELFVAGLASCVAFYARRYLRRHRIDPVGLEVTTGYRMGSKPARVAVVDMVIRLPAELAPQRRAGLLAQAGHCTVHNSIAEPPDITITLTTASGAAATTHHAGTGPAPQ